MDFVVASSSLCIHFPKFSKCVCKRCVAYNSAGKLTPGNYLVFRLPGKMKPGEKNGDLAVNKKFVYYYCLVRKMKKEDLKAARGRVSAAKRNITTFT